jgi:predicted phosphodiesterase
MTKLCVLTDWHIGHPGNGKAFSINTPWPEGASELADRLSHLCTKETVDTLVCCGDLTHTSTSEEIDRGVDFLVRAGCRNTILTLGNHDLMDPAALSRWRDRLGHNGAIQWQDSVISLDDCEIILITSRWWYANNALLEWSPNRTPIGVFEDQQLKWLDEVLEAGRPVCPAVIVSHFPVTYWVNDGHIPTVHENSIFENQAGKLWDIFARHPRVRMHLSGHTHETRITHCPWGVSVTTAAFNEVPFSIRIIDISSEAIRVETRDLGRDSDPVSGLSVLVTGQREADRAAVISSRRLVP